MALQKGFRRLFEFLRVKQRGEVLEERQILEVTEWSPSTFATYLRKNKLIKYLEQVADHQFLTLTDGPTINEADFERAVTQVSQAEPVLTEGASLQGRADLYRLVVPLGEGAVGKVWRAHAVLMRESVAVKVMLPRRDLLDPRRIGDVEKRFEREGRNGLKLSHPALVRHLDTGSWNGLKFIVLALAHGSVKDKLISNGGTLSLKDTIPIMRATVEALSYLHSNKCIHRDVKPSNMLLVGSNYVLSDLGVVRWSDLNPDFTEAGTITNDSVQLGSLRYMAPEQQASSHEAVPQSDVYALGMSWFELLTGSTIPAAQAAVGDFAAPTPNVRATDTIRKMLAYQASARPSLSELRRILSDLADNP